MSAKRKYFWTCKKLAIGQGYERVSSCLDDETKSTGKNSFFLAFLKKNAKKRYLVQKKKVCRIFAYAVKLFSITNEKARKHNRPIQSFYLTFRKEKTSNPEISG